MRMAAKPANQNPQPAPKPKPEPKPRQQAAAKPQVSHQLSPSDHAELVKLIRSTEPGTANFGRDKDGERKTKGK